MNRWQKRLSPPPGLASYIKAPIVVGDNDLLIGKPIPPSVELTPAGPVVHIVEGQNDSAQEEVNNLMRAALASSQATGSSSLLYSQTAANLNTTEAAVQGLLDQSRTRLRRDSMVNERPDPSETSGEEAVEKPINDPKNDAVVDKTDEGDFSVWGTLSQHHLMIMRSLAKRFCHALDPHVLQDCIQQAAVDLAVRVTNNPGSAARWAAVARKDLYLLRAADRLARREIREKHRNMPCDPQGQGMQEIPEPNTSGPRSMQDEVMALMLAALATLPRQQRNAWVEYRRLASDPVAMQKGPIYAQLAENLNTTENAVRGLLNRARTRLREYVQRQLNTGSES